MNNNPLLEPFNTPFETAPFSKIEEKHYKPAFIKAIEVAKKEINIITQNKEKPTFKNTVEALEFSGTKLERISSIFFNLNAAETNKKIQQIAQEISPLLSEFSNDIMLNEKLFKRISSIYKQKETLNLTPEQNTLLTKKYKSFTRNGANLSEKNKQKLRSIDTKIAKLKLQFGENVLAETNNYQLHITNKKEVEGIPENAIETAQQLAKQQSKKGYIFTLAYPSYIPFVTYAKNRELRKEITLAFGKKGFQKNKYNNEKIVLKLVKLRHKRANLLSYKTHAHFTLEERMAKTPENVFTFLNDLLEKAKPEALNQFNKLKKIAQKDGVHKIEKWDSAYYSEKLKKKFFSFNQEEIKPYFKLENVINGVFKISNLLFDLHFEEITNIDTYHPEVKTYKVTNNKNEYIAILYTDFFPREGKRNGAWMTSFKGQWIKNNQNSRPHISVVCNFTKPTKTKPSLLTFNEVTTLFHEFGHALHGMLANTTYPSLSGTNVFWDFVELPSQLLENWCYQPEALKLFAKHYKTNQPIPAHFIEKIKASSNFLEGIQTLRQLSFGFLDMNWHTTNGKNITSVKEFEKKAFKNTQLYPSTKENCMSTAFSHIFQGGYSSGYYSYKWAEVLDADAFTEFESKGIFNKKTANLFKTNILQKGGTQNPMILYKAFRKKKPNNKALLKRAGLL